MLRPPRAPSRTQLAALLALALACRAGPERSPAAAAPALVYPETPRGALVEELHGVRVADPYRWLEAMDAPETRAWVAAQNALADGWLDTPEREALRARLVELWAYPRLELPLRSAGRTFYRRNDGSQNQGVLYVADGDVPRGGRVVVDPNGLSDDGTLALIEVYPSRDGELVACGFSDGGSDWRVFQVREAASGAPLPDEITGNKFGDLRWAANGAGFYYPRTDAPADGDALGASPPPDIAFHEIGTDERADVVVVPRPSAPGRSQGVEVASGGEALFVLRFDAATRNSEILRVPLDARGRAAGPPQNLTGDRFDAQFAYVADDGRTLWAFTDLGAPRGRVVAIDLDDPRRERWREVVPEGQDALRVAKGFGGHLIVSWLHDCRARVGVFRTDGTAVGELELPGAGTVASFEGSWEDPLFHFSYESFLQAPSVYRHDLARGATEAVHVPALAFDPAPYVTAQELCTSPDGTRVPVFLTHRRDLVRDGSAPAYLYGYGGFCVPVTPFFSPANLVWLELGGVLAVANLRGGGEFGEAWHRAGTKLAKQNVFDDFQAVARQLVREGLTRPERLAIGGRSNGGLLVGACLTQSPELFGAALADVGVLDMLRYHLFTIGWAWAGDYGTADDQGEFRALHAYSPLHNVRAGTRYPPTLLSTGDHDDRVVPAHSYKFAAALQAAQAGDAPILLRTETRAGHGGGKPIALQVDDAADHWAFLARVFGLHLERP